MSLKYLRPGKISLVWLAHLLLVPVIVGLFLTGMRISVSNSQTGLAHWLTPLLPQGEMHQWHTRFAAVLLAALSIYLLQQLLHSRFKTLKVRKQKLANPESQFRLLIWLGLTLTGCSLISGLMLVLLPMRPPLLTPLHHYSAWGGIVFFLLHPVTAVLSRGWHSLWRVFRPRPSSATGASICLVLAAGIALTGWTQLTQTDQVLHLIWLEGEIELDGEGREAAWQDAKPISVQTYNGYGPMAELGTEVTVRALRDDTYGYFLLQWQDPTRSLTHLPLIKTTEGWKVYQSSAANADENQFYEDKFAVMLSRSNQLAGAGTVHLGDKPLAEHPRSSGGRGLHYTLDHSITDVWHWKAVRTGLSLGQADDNYFGPPKPSKSEYKRYTGGYQKDKDDCEHLVRFEGNDFHLKPECGGFMMNWAMYSDDVIQPLRLPKHPDVLKRMGTANLDPELSDNGRWWLEWEDTERYHADRDTWPVGTVIPSVISLGRFSQGRGGVDAGANWQNGTWTLELKRKLAVNSEYDLPIEDGIYLWLAAFDHSQTRHSYHMKPLKLQLAH